ncbi:MAG: hypothetical protein OEM49_09310 [Myxococcales bacterium]|nr:hypothetical protein [Myxococcales bacterium]
MRHRAPLIALRVVLCMAVVPLLGCPQIVFGIPASMRRPLRFAAPESSTEHPEFARVYFEFERSEFILFYRLLVDGQRLEPTLGGCRKIGLPRVARKSEEAREKFCHADFVRLVLEAGAEHRIVFAVEAEHQVAVRRRLEPGRNMRWIMPVRTQPIELALELEPGQAYVIRAEEKDLALREALGQDAPPETSRDLEKYEPVFQSGVEVGTLSVRVKRRKDGEILRELSAPLYSGKLACGPPFCASE